MIKTQICEFIETFKKEMIYIRETVFCDEQGFSRDIELDGLDDDCVHVLAKFNGHFIGTGRMQKDGHIGRIAVLKDYRGQKIGTQIIKTLINHAKESGLNRVFLGSQIQAISFYESLEFVQYGEVFLEEGVEHIYMELISN